jgi:hypothetical protein
MISRYRHINQIDATNRALIIPDDKIAYRQPGQHQAEPQPGLAWGVHAFLYQFHRGTGRDRPATQYPCTAEWSAPRWYAPAGSANPRP